MKGVTKPRLLPLLSSKCLHWLQIEIIIKVKIIEVLPVYQEVQHVVTLTTDLKPRLHPVQFRRLEELRLFKRSKQVPSDHMTSHMTIIR